MLTSPHKDPVMRKHFPTTTSVCLPDQLTVSKFSMGKHDKLNPNPINQIGQWLHVHKSVVVWTSSGIHFNSLRPRRNRRHFADDIFKCIFLNQNELISFRISLKFVPKVRINNIPPLIQIMARRRPGDKPLSEAMVISLPTHICVTRPQCYGASYWKDCDDFF